jgi:hypothetical protein
MKKYLYFSIALLVLLSVIGYEYRQIQVIREERELYRRDTYNLLTDIEQYRTRDSLYVASIEQLCLTVGEYKKYRQEDMKLIASLKVDKNRLQQVTTAQTQTTYELEGVFKDSIVRRNKLREAAEGAPRYAITGREYRYKEAFQRAKASFFDSINADKLKCIQIHEKWFDMNGCIDANAKFTGRFESRDSLLYVEHVVPKRFWFIRWGVKERRQEVVSKNPHTKITGAEFITIRK